MKTLLQNLTKLSLIVLISTPQMSFGLSCVDVLKTKVPKKRKVPSSSRKVMISGVEREVVVVQKENLDEYVILHGIDGEVLGSMDSESLPLLWRSMSFSFLLGLTKFANRIQSLFTKSKVFRRFKTFEGPEDGVLRSADIMKIGRQLIESGISINDVSNYDIRIGRILFKGSEFQKLLKKARNESVVRVDLNFGFKDGAANALSLLYQVFPRAWYVGAMLSPYLNYSQSFVDVSVQGLGVYVIASLSGSVSSIVRATHPDSLISKLSIFLPNITGVFDVSNYNVVRRKRAAVAVDNIEYLGERVKDWKSILVVVESRDQAKLLHEELAKRFSGEKD